MGKALAPLDMMIAAHSVAVDAILVISDGAFAGVPGVKHESWATEFGSLPAGKFIPLE